jgi:hypothetical protein
MTKIDTTCKHAEIRLIAASVAFQSCTRTDGTETRIPGTDKRILIGNDAYLAKVAAPAEQSSTAGAAKAASLDNAMLWEPRPSRSSATGALMHVSEDGQWMHIDDVRSLLASSAVEQAKVTTSLTGPELHAVYVQAQGGVDYGLVAVANAALRHAATQAAPASPEQVHAEPPRMSTDESREYLVKFTERYFTDKTFHRYIRNDQGNRQGLAGDFAWQLARALRMILASNRTLPQGD